MTRYREALAVIVALTLICSGALAQDEAPPNVQVTVDGAAVSFDEPVLMVDMVFPLLPAETFLTALGATSDWNPGAQRLDVERGRTAVQMWVGRDWITVDGTRREMQFGLQTLSGEPYVPGPATAKLFGFDVQWDQTALMLTMTRARTMPEGPTVAATLLEVREAEPSLLVRVDESGQVGDIPLSADPVVRRGVAEDTPASAEIADLQPGDQVEIVFDEANTAVGIQARYAQALGTITSIQGNQLTLESGQSYPLGAGVEAFGSNGAPLHLLAAVGQGAILTLNPASNSVWRILAQRRGTVNPPATDTPIIAAFMLPRYDQPLGEGDSLAIRIVGSANATATVALGTTGQQVTVSEGEPGVYAGEMTIPEGLLVPDEHLVAQLEDGGNQSQRVQSNRSVTIDAQSPTLAEEHPAHQAAEAPPGTDIRIRYHDGEGTGVDTTTATLELDGTDVTADTDVADDRMVYNPPGDLPRGQHSARAQIADELGNVATRTWIFSVAGAERGITGVSHDADAPLSPGDTITVTAEVTAPGQDAGFSIEGVVENVEMARVGETSTYRGTYTVEAGDVAADATVTVHFTAADGTEYEAAAAARVTIAQPEVAFAISIPEAGAETGRRIRPAGTAPPGSDVRWAITYQEFILQGEVASGTAEADAEGNWQAETEVDLKLLLVGMADRYTLTAELLRDDGGVEETKTVKFTADD